MKTTKNNFLKNTSLSSNLVDAVLTQMGLTFDEFKENTEDYRDASAGISGFTYYNDTHKFAIENQSEILSLLDEMADQFGEDVVEVVKNFGVFRGSMDKDEKKDLYKFLGSNSDESAYETSSVLNVMAWLCVEQLANEVSDFVYENK